MTNHQDTSTERELLLVPAMLDAYIEAIKASGEYERWHYIPEVESARDAVAQSLAALASRDEAAQQPQGQAGYEHEMALMEAHRNAEEVAYFEARPSRDEVNARHVFGAAFLRGWRASNKSHPVPQGQAVSDERVEELAAQFDISVSAVRAILSLRDKSVVKESLTTERVPLSDGRQYRLLQSGLDKILPSDEFLSEDATTWAVDPNGIFVGMTYGGRVLRPARRAIGAALATQQKGGAV